MKVFTVFVCAFLCQFLAHAQSIEVLWQRQLEPNEKFLAISRDNLLILTCETEKSGKGILRVFDTQQKKLIDSLFTDDITTADFSPNGKAVFCASNIVSYNEPITISWFGTTGSIAIHSLSGELVRLFHYSGTTSTHEFVWNTDDHNGNRVPPGLYYCTLKDSYGATLSKPLFILY